VIILYLQHFHIVQNDLLVLLLLLGRIGVVEAHNEPALEDLLVVIVEEGGLGVSHMEEAAGLWREANHHLAQLRPRQVNKLPARAFLLLILGGVLKGGRLDPRRLGQRGEDRADLGAGRHHGVPAEQARGRLPLLQLPQPVGGQLQGTEHAVVSDTEHKVLNK